MLLLRPSFSFPSPSLKASGAWACSRRAQRFAPTNMLARLSLLSRRGFSSSSHAVAAATKEAPVAPSLWKVFHGISPISVPMDEPFPGVPPLVGVPSTPITTQITKLPNGVSVVTDNRPGLLASVGVFSRSGSAAETDASAGSAFVQQRAALKDTTSRSHFSIIRDIERIGATAAANAGRDSFDLIGDVHVDSVEQLLAIFGDSLLHPKTSAYHFRVVADAAVEDSKQLESDASSVLTECAHAAGFGGRGLGRRSNPGSSIIASLSPQDFSRHVAASSSPSAITVAASGVDHATFVAAAAGIFGGLKGSAAAPAPSGWTGGDSRASMSGDGLCHIALNFQGASQSSKDLVPLAVLSTLLGGGDSFSSGGPGKGMTSKLYENVLNRHHYVASALATHFMYGTAGMFTLKGSCDPSAAGQLAGVLAKELKDCVDKVDPAQLERARNATASIVLINNEHGAINAEDMGRQVMFTGGRIMPEQLLAQINAVTAADIQRVAKGLISSKVALAAVGDVSYVPSYDAIAQLFK